MTIFNKIYPCHSLLDESPTHNQLIRSMTASDIRYTSWRWLSRFSSKNLNVSTDVCECLEFKHHLAELVAHFCPDVMPESYAIDDFSWSMVLSQLAEKHYTTPQTVSDHIDNVAWILKPSLLNNGQHIKIFDRLSQIEEHYLTLNRMGGPHVLQRYVQNPDLYDGRKYSLRYFVVISQEAGVFLYKKGYLNVALAPYPSHEYHPLNAHLTNEHLDHDSASVTQMPTSGMASESIWYEGVQSIVQQIAQGLKQGFPHMYAPQKDRAFALFGFDFLVDVDERVWLLEANHGPCFPIQDEHPLQQSLYHGFWEDLLQQFVWPIVRNKPIQSKMNNGFDAIVGPN